MAALQRNVSAFIVREADEIPIILLEPLEQYIRFSFRYCKHGLRIFVGEVLICHESNE